MAAWRTRGRTFRYSTAWGEETARKILDQLRRCSRSTKRGDGLPGVGPACTTWARPFSHVFERVSGITTNALRSGS